MKHASSSSIAWIIGGNERPLNVIPLHLSSQWNQYQGIFFDFQMKLIFIENFQNELILSKKFGPSPPWVVPF